MSQKLKFHQKEGVNFIYCFLQPRSLLDWKKEMQLSQTMEFLKGETVARVTPEKIWGSPAMISATNWGQFRREILLKLYHQGVLEQ
jgi:hypothetical protein